MTIAINLTNFVSGASKVHICEQFERLAMSRPDDQFIFITTRNQKSESVPVANITYITSGFSATSALLWKFWYSYRLPALAKKHKASVLVNTDGVCSLHTRLPQCLFVTDIAFINPASHLAGKHYKYLQKNTPQFLKKSATTIVSTQSLQNKIAEYYNVSKDKLVIVPMSVSPLYKSLQWEEKEKVKDNFADGREYFLFNGPTNNQGNIINLLKAFSLFKKRQKSNMQLLITTQQSMVKNGLTESLKNYKYRDEVKLLFSRPDIEVARITAAAYAFVYPVFIESFPVEPLQAIQCETPVIASDINILREIAGDAAVYINPEDVPGIAEKMMLLFKNESQRDELINNGRSLVKEYQQANHVDLLWRAITSI